MLYSIDIESLRDMGVVIVLSSIDIESLRDMGVVIMLSSIDIKSPVRGININRIRDILHSQITLAEGLILIRTRKMYGMRKREGHLKKMQDQKE